MLRKKEKNYPKPMKVHGWVIDPVAQTIRAKMFVDQHFLEEAYAFIGCELIEGVSRFEVSGLNGKQAVKVKSSYDMLYVDEEALLKKNDDPWFGVPSKFSQPLKGRGIILGVDADGNSCSAGNDIEVYKRLIVWLEGPELQHQWKKNQQEWASLKELVAKGGRA